MPIKRSAKKNSKILTGNDLALDKRELESLFNKKTRGIVFNNPNNPSGRVYTLEDLRFIADLVKKYDVMVISDEIYEWRVFKPYKHINFGKSYMSRKKKVYFFLVVYK